MTLFGKGLQEGSGPVPYVTRLRDLTGSRVVREGRRGFPGSHYVFSGRGGVVHGDRRTSQETCLGEVVVGLLLSSYNKIRG